MNPKNKRHVIAVTGASARLRGTPLRSGCFATTILLLLAGCALAAGATVDIKVDQVGYPTGAPKVALVASKTAASRFTVRRARDAGVAFRGALSSAVDDPDSGDRVQTADFSKLTAAGKYYVEIAGVGRSWEFAIGPDVYGRAWYLAMSMTGCAAPALVPGAMAAMSADSSRKKPAEPARAPAGAT